MMEATKLSIALRPDWHSMLQLSLIVVELSFSQPRHRHSKIFAGFVNDGAKEFPFCRVNERMRGENPGERSNFRPECIRTVNATPLDGSQE